MVIGVFHLNETIGEAEEIGIFGLQGQIESPFVRLLKVNFLLKFYYATSIHFVCLHKELSVFITTYNAEGYHSILALISICGRNYKNLAIHLKVLSHLINT